VRAGVATSTVALACLCACGYVGPVVPPSPELPTSVADLSVVERGDQIQITFSTPVRTTDNLPITHFSEIDLRLGPAPQPFDFDRWSAAARRIPLQPPEPSGHDDPRPRAMEDTVPVASWVGQRIAIAVRTAIKRKDHYSPWSNVVRLEIIPPLEVPSIKVEATAQGVKIAWPPEGDGLHFEIYRQGPADKEPVHIGTAEHNDFIDATAQYDTRYQYSVIAAKAQAESLPSKTAEITPVDIFPPSVPASITALATPVSIEVSWQRSPEPDLKGYYVYRSVEGSALARVGDLATLPTYSDHQVEHGKTYRYEVSAIDQKNNESAKSSPAEVTF
jgi:fibronectin type 3 domain-containing protein